MMEVHLTEDEMAEIKKEVLTTLRHYLCEKIRADRHLDYLRSCRILNRNDAEYIYAQAIQTDRTSRLLDYLAENPRGLDALIDSIKKNGTQNFIIAKITDEVQKAKNEKIELLKAQASSSPSDGRNLTPSSLSDLPLSLSNNSTLLFHPEGERSPSASDTPASLSLPSLKGGGDLASAGALSFHAVSSAPSSSLPRPGDPGAPPLPDEVESPSDLGTPGCTSAGGDPNFQPLRSRSLTPTSHRNAF